MQFGRGDIARGSQAWSPEAIRGMHREDLSGPTDHVASGLVFGPFALGLRPGFGDPKPAPEARPVTG
jgi:hypothetical protein